MAMAGAGRVFDLCDEVPETDEGDVELVNICYDSNGEIHETEELTEMWAWKKPNAANKDEMYTRLQGDVSEVSFYNYDIEYKQKNGKIFGE